MRTPCAGWAVRGYLGPRHPAVTPTPHPPPDQGCRPAASSVQGEPPQRRMVIAPNVTSAEAEQSWCPV